jgi:hypothetical protein
MEERLFSGTWLHIDLQNFTDVSEKTTAFISTSYSRSHVRTSVKNLTFNYSFTSLWCCTCSDRYSYHQVLRHLLLRTPNLQPMNTIPKYALVYAPMCCCAPIICNSNCVSISRMECICVSYNVVGCEPACSAGWFLLCVVCSCLCSCLFHKFHKMLRRARGCSGTLCCFCLALRF